MNILNAIEYIHAINLMVKRVNSKLCLFDCDGKKKTGGKKKSDLDSQI